MDLQLRQQLVVNARKQRRDARSCTGLSHHLIVGSHAGACEPRRCGGQPCRTRMESRPLLTPAMAAAGPAKPVSMPITACTNTRQEAPEQPIQQGESEALLCHQGNPRAGGSLALLA